MLKQDKLITRIKQSGYTQKDLARLMEISQPQISEIVNGRRVTMNELIKFCKVFHCRIEDLVEVEK